MLDVYLRSLPGDLPTASSVGVYDWARPEAAQITSSTWLPLVEKHLSHEWMIITRDVSKAVLADDADVPKLLWNRRCSLVFPRHNPNNLECLRSLVKGRQVRRLYLEASQFLRKVFGVSWESVLVVLWQSQSSSLSGEQSRGELSRKLENWRELCSPLKNFGSCDSCDSISASYLS